MIVAFSRSLFLFVLVILLSSTIYGQQYVIDTFAGGRPPASTPVPARSVAIPYMGGVAVDAAGQVYFHAVNSVFKLTPDGMLIRFAGTTERGYNGDNRPAVTAWLYTDDEGWVWQAGIAADSAGNVYIADSYNSRVRKVSRDGLITTVAGNGKPGFSGDGGPAVDAQLSSPGALALDPLGNFYIADAPNHRVRRVSTDGIITTVAGNGVSGYSGDGGLAVDAQLRYPWGLAVDSSGNVFIADMESRVVRRVAPNGLITTVAGNGAAESAGDGGAASAASLDHPSDVGLDAAGNLYILDSKRVRKVAPDGTISTVAGGPGGYGGMAVAPDGALYIAGGTVLHKLAGGTLTAVAGTGERWFGGDGGPASNAQFLTECCAVLAADREGSLYIADTGSARIRKVSPSGVISTVAGTGVTAFSGDGGPATSAPLMQPRAVALSLSGDLFIADGFNYRIRKVSREGIITTVAGNGTPGHSGDGGAATAASIGHIFGIAVDRHGNLYMAEVGVIAYGISTGHRIRKVSPDGIISTVAESTSLTRPGEHFMPLGIAVDSAGAVYFTDHGGHRVLRATADGGVRVFAGTGVPGTAGEGGPANSAQLDTPISLAVDENDNVYIGEAWKPRLRRVSPDGTITTIAGTGVGGHSGDGGPATRAEIAPVAGIAVGTQGEIYLSAYFWQPLIRVLRPSTSAE